MVQENVELLTAEGKLQVGFKPYRFAEGIVGLWSDFHQQIDIAAACAVVDSRTEQSDTCAVPEALAGRLAAELAYGVAKSGSERNRRALEMFLAPLEIVPFDEKAVWAYGELRADLERLGQPVGSLDTVIAAHALSLNDVLVTSNIRELSRVRGLRLENWVE